MDPGGADGDAGASEFAGGGFMPPSTPTQGQGQGGPGGAFSPSAGGAGKRVSALVYPFTVRHFHNCCGSAGGGDVLSVFNQEISNVVFAGKVVQVDSRTTDLTFLLDDGTGKIEIRKWHDDSELAQEMIHSIQVGVYVKVHGLARKLGSKNTISANSIRQITDMNEYTCHFLDCIFAYQYSRKKAEGTAAGPGAGAGGGGGGMHPSQQVPGGGAAAGFASAPPSQQPRSGPGSGPGPVPVQPYGYSAQGGAAGGGGRGPGSAPYPQGGSGRPSPSPAASQNLGMGMPVHEQVLNYFSDNEKNMEGERKGVGLHRDEVIRNLPGIAPRAVMDAIEFLVNEGHLYSTIDDLHFKTLGEN